MALLTQPSRWPLILAVAILGVVLVGVSPAYAHNVVEDRTPAPGSTVTESPVAISITSNDIFLDLGGDASGFGIVVTDDAGLYYGDGCVTLEERVMQAVVELGEAGSSEVIYQFVSADGHPLSESYEFVFTPEPGHTPALGYDTPAECGVPREAAPLTDEPVVDTAPVPLEEVTTVEPARDPLLIIGFLSIVSIAVVVWIVWRVRQKRDDV